ncbi:hypothetical protein PHET_05371 [Paragonimus heterotremus]|uniref:Uncharacterized protein n=1 Tax=Paragonimus heterotremus TaxID=100268 RepID=A0A8J4WI00_9TREM|nr:hypothetical protein PHET_05371 [Paragonimus heterotremus]
MLLISSSLSVAREEFRLISSIPFHFLSPVGDVVFLCANN